MNKPSSSSNNTSIIVMGLLIALVVVIGAFFFVLKQVNGVSLKKEDPAVVTQRPLVTDLPTFASPIDTLPIKMKSEDVVFGPREAKVLVYEYSDLECPFCKNFHTNTLGDLLATYPTDLALVYRYFPLESIHPAAPMEAQAIACAAQQDESVARDFIILNYKESAATGNSYSQQQYIDLGGRAGVDTRALSSCLNGKNSKQIVDADIADGKSLQVIGTPTFFFVRQRDNYAVRVEGAFTLAQNQQLVDFLLSH